MAIRFHDEKIHSGIKQKRAIKSWVKSVIESEQKKTGSINLILTSDMYLRSINKAYLSRDYNTDIITFDYSEGSIISGDLFISLERVNENAVTYGESREKELLRVIIHGILHLMGYGDAGEEEKKEMRKREDQYLRSYIEAE